MKNVRGGLEKYLLTAQKELDTEISFVYLVEGNDCIFEDEIIGNNGKVIFIPYKHPVKKYIWFLIKKLKELRKDIDTLYINVNGISSDIVIILLAYFCKFKLIVHSHNARMEPIEHPFYRILHNILEFIAVNVLKCIRCKRIAVSEKAGKYLFKNKTFDLVFPGIDIRNYLFDIEKRNRIRMQLGVEEEILYGYVGRIVEIKNPFFVIDIFEKICMNNISKRVMLVVVGDGDSRKKMELYAQQKGICSNIIFTGEVQNVEDYFCAIDCLIAPSFSEGLGLTAIEAQASGIPVLCSFEGFPMKSVGITPLIKFLKIKEGAEYWAAISFLENNSELETRKEWNKIVAKSSVDIKNVANNLKEIFLEKNDDKK